MGCPKNEVDSAKLAGTLTAEGFGVADAPELADLVVVNTCAFVEAARQESIDTVLTLDRSRRKGSRLVVTGCLAERYGGELGDALPEVDLVAPFGFSLIADRPDHGDGQRPSDALSTASAPVPVAMRRKPAGRTAEDRPVSDFDLLNLPRPPSSAPWAYVKVAEGCDRHCGFCAIPSFRGRQRSRPSESIFAEVGSLAASGRLQEIVLVAQDLASFGLDRWRGASPASSTVRASSGAAPRSPHGRHRRRPIVDLVKEVSECVEWVRLLYLYPSRLDDELTETIIATGVPYFDLSLQHVSRPLLAGMRRPGNGERFLDRIRSIRVAAPGAAFRSSFIIGYPGETEDDHDLLLDWLDEARLDWVGFFPFSREEGTPAGQAGGQVPAELVAERIRECSERQDAITAARRDELIGETVRVLVVARGVGRTYREAPEIDGIVRIPADLEVGSFADLVVTGAAGPDLEASRSVAPSGLR